MNAPTSLASMGSTTSANAGAISRYGKHSSTLLIVFRSPLLSLARSSAFMEACPRVCRTWTISAVLLDLQMFPTTDCSTTSYGVTQQTWRKTGNPTKEE
ncbi:serine/threonine-protein phosphatase PP-Z [Coccidioides immitis H538.4]|uniref:Serine/threonine-protein phosphatase PP-Z n=1 Tax=Coccidioides immitis H538.4 TaxID=396776 RepID=A0A0J8RFM2_COCIT|nr:serine/threonine-protein phosphatase PP-Z [Coccidioides immitis H538.4]